MRLPPGFPALSLLPALLAGCLADEAPPPQDEDEPTGGRIVDGRFELDPPAWEVGLWWNYTWDGAPSSSYVVANSSSTDWQMETDNPTVAFFDARNDISFLGPIRKVDLAGSQGEARVKYFAWPLYEGRTWSTTWDGEPVDIVARHAGDGVFEFEARDADRLLVAYTYDPAVRWFRDLTFYDEEGGVEFAGRLSAHGSAYAATLVRWSLHDTVNASGQGTTASTLFFSVPEAATDLWIEYQIVCFEENRPWSITVRPSDAAQAGQAWTRNGPPCDGEPFAGVVREDPAPGGWEVAYSWAEDLDKPVYAIEVIVRELVQFGVEQPGDA